MGKDTTIQQVHCQCMLPHLFAFLPRHPGLDSDNAYAGGPASSPRVEAHHRPVRSRPTLVAAFLSAQLRAISRLRRRRHGYRSVHDPVLQAVRLHKCVVLRSGLPCRFYNHASSNGYTLHGTMANTVLRLGDPVLQRSGNAKRPVLPTHSDQVKVVSFGPLRHIHPGIHER